MQYKLVKKLSIDQFPFPAMGCYFIAILFKRYKMSQLMQQGDQECEFVKIAIYANPVVGMMGPVAVIPQYAFAFTGYR
jgi:hypothetical protein